MCGIFAVLNSNPGAPRSLEDFVRDAFIASGVRGTDSAGMFQVDKDKDVFYHKLPVSGTTFIENKVAQNMINDSDIKCMTIAHVRKATEGKVKLDNAHPFASEQDENGEYVIGVHNGTLTGWKVRKGGSNYDVDSEWAINHIANNGIAAFKDFVGAYAFVWYDTRTPDVINVCRNKERTLYYAFMEDPVGTVIKRAKTCLIASEHGMLHWLAGRNQLPIEKEMFAFEPGFHYQFNIDDVTQFTKTKIEVHEPYVAPIQNRSAGGWSYADSKKTLMAAVKTALNAPKKETTVGGSVPSTQLTTVHKPGDTPSYAISKGLVSQDEEDNAVAMAEIDAVYDFEAGTWDAAAGELLGTCDIAPSGYGDLPGGQQVVSDIVDCTFRGLSEKQAQDMLSGYYKNVKGKVVGITYEKANDGTHSNMVYVLAIPTYMLNPSMQSATMN